MKRDFTQGVEMSHQLLKQDVEEGETVIDATAGNGYDTLFLAELVGDSGYVYSFDIQQEAIDNTRERLRLARMEDRVRLCHTGHENVLGMVSEEVGAIIFNLGYRPGGKKDIKTRPETSLTALKSGLTLLKKSGIIVIVIYTGHKGGKTEREILLNYSAGLNQDKYNVLYYHFINQDCSPEVLAIKKR
ncbi:MAG: methyltransferase domain-containing protein [Firmicutes bacterium]|nr:methyltransferase domain-containing protein [Bacillota bacterium]